MKHTAIIAIFTLLILSACKTTPGAYATRGQPESLIDASGERVNLSLAGDNATNELANWVGNDQPTRAEISCDPFSEKCKKAEAVLRQFGVSIKHVSRGTSDVVLIYERMSARDCDNRFVSNHYNPLNLNHPTFGCSTAVNMLQQISNRKQLVSPSTLDPQDAERSSRVFRRYLNQGN